MDRMNDIDQKIDTLMSITESMLDDKKDSFYESELALYEEKYEDLSKIDFDKNSSLEKNAKINVNNNSNESIDRTKDILNQINSYLEKEKKDSN